MGRAPSPPNAKAPPCAMCGDPRPPKMQIHAEDYSRPFRWEPPAAYPVCARCHSRLHFRFKAPERWSGYRQFLRRGRYGREVSSDDLKKLVEAGMNYQWRIPDHELPRREGHLAWWWEALTMDPSSL